MSDNVFGLGWGVVPTWEAVAPTRPDSTPASGGAKPVLSIRESVEAASRIEGQALRRDHFETTTVRTVIESLGVYLPARAVSSAEIVAACPRAVGLPLERLTGIRSRRVVGEQEYAIDLAEKAARDCLSRSAYGPDEIDLLICCNVSRCDGPDQQLSYEPSTAARLRRRLGLSRAVCFDLMNACAGTFTAVAVADAYLAAGAARQALIVSGEYVSYLRHAVQADISECTDPRWASLTLGDSGAAMVLHRRAGAAGFHALDLYTLGRFHHLSVAKAADRPGGKPTLWSHADSDAAISIRRGAAHALETLSRQNWQPESVHHFVFHQSSVPVVEGTARELNRLVGQNVCHPGNLTLDLTDHGNTVSNSHAVALADQIDAGQVQPGQRLMFGISGAGQTIGTALYQMDELPSRHRDWQRAERRPAVRVKRQDVRVRVAGLGVCPETEPRQSLAMLRAATEASLAEWGQSRDRIGLIVHSGVYRSEFLSEPALAAILAGEAHINADVHATRRTLAFDVMNGSVGFLNACHLAGQWLHDRRTEAALVLASEVDNNRSVWPDNPLGLLETATALILEPSPDGREGFVGFAFRLAGDDGLRTHTIAHHQRLALAIQRTPSQQESVLRLAIETARELLTRERLHGRHLRWLAPPRLSPAMLERLALELEVPLDRLLLLPGRADPFTSALPLCLAEAHRQGLALSGDLGLFVTAGSGLQAAATLYQW